MSTTLFAGLSPEDLIAQEAEHQATEPPTSSTLGKRTSPSGDPDDDDHGEDEEEQGGENPPSNSGSATHQNPGSLRMEQAIRRTAKRLKLSNEDISLVEAFAQVSAVNQPPEADD